jgi:hypothetical protein
MSTIIVRLIEETTEETDSGETMTWVYLVNGPTTSYAAKRAAGIPQRGTYFSGTFLRVVNVTAERWETPTNYKVTVTFSRPYAGYSPDVVEGYEYWRLALGTQQVEIQTAYEQKKYGTNPREMNKCINVDAEGIPQGISVLAQQLQLQVTKFFSPDAINSNYIHDVKAEITKVNSVTYYSFDAGELIFLGGEITNKEDNAELIPITFNFGIEQNLTSDDLADKYIDIETGSGIIITDGKDGWNYIFADARANGSAGSANVQVGCQGVYVNRTYKTSDFTSLLLSGEL